MARRAAGRRPWYMAGNNCSVPRGQVFEPLLLEGGVDVAVFGESLRSGVCYRLGLVLLIASGSICNSSFLILGHVHNMQHINPIANGISDPAGLSEQS